MKTEDSVEKFHPRSPFSFCDPGSRSAIRMEFSKGTASFRSVYVLKKFVLFHLSKNSYRKFHVDGKRSWKLIKNSLLHIIFSTLFLVQFGYPNETLSLVFDILHEFHHIQLLKSFSNITLLKGLQIFMCNCTLMIPF